MSIAPNSMLFSSLLRAPCSLLHDWIMNLPKELSAGFWNELSSYEEEKKMRYVTSVEKIGVEKGIQQGIQQGMLQTAREVLIETLETRFDVIGRSLMEIINDIDDASLLKMLHKSALTTTSLDKFKGIMEEMLKQTRGREQA